MGDIQEYSLMSLEMSASLFIMVVAIKLYKCRFQTRSGCCGDQIQIETQNPGSTESFPEALESIQTQQV